MSSLLTNMLKEIPFTSHRLVRPNECRGVGRFPSDKRPLFGKNSFCPGHHVGGVYGKMRDTFIPVQLGASEIMIPKTKEVTLTAEITTMKLWNHSFCNISITLFANVLQNNYLSFE
mmetsp:Transcript_8181/g.10513  ORF Transcript_8181/g.10513 Transcript_8181/m.10513 type:complete len:116 (+) Transcript_8181:311-658(+)